MKTKSIFKKELKEHAVSVLNSCGVQGIARKLLSPDERIIASLLVKNDFLEKVTTEDKHKNVIYYITGYGMEFV